MAMQRAHTAEVAEITEDDARLIAELLDDSRAKETRRSYESAIRTFTAWAQKRGHTAFPSSPLTVAAYVAHRDQAGRSYATIARDVAAIAAAHSDRGHPDPTQQHGVRQVLRAVARRRGTSPTRQAAPLTIELVRRTIDAMGARSDLADLRDAAIILIGYAAALRRSEIADLLVGDFALRDKGMLMTLRSSKTDQEGRGDMIGIPYGANPATCPVVALQEWLEASGRSKNPDAPVFSRIHGHKKIGTGPLSDRSIARIIQARALDAGISEQDARSWVSGHSLRAGHATTAADHGLDLATIARTTRHKRLDTLARYVRPSRVLDDSTAGHVGL